MLPDGPAFDAKNIALFAVSVVTAPILAVTGGVLALTAVMVVTLLAPVAALATLGFGRKHGGWVHRTQHAM